MIAVDKSLCRRIGLCEALAPETFLVGDEHVELLPGGPSDGPEVDSAVGSCPMQALRLEP